MTKVKDVIEQYLIENFDRIEQFRSTGQIVWQNEADNLEQETGKRIHPEALRNRFKRMREKKGIIFSKPAPTRDFKVSYTESLKSGTAELENLVATEIKTLEDLVRVCNIDLSVWDIEKWICNKWDMGLKGVGGKTSPTPMFQIKVFLKKKPEGAIDYKKEWVDFISRQEIRRTKPDLQVNAIEKSRKSQDNLLVINAFDAHFGKMAWDKEVGEDYDISIAKKRFVNTVKEIALRAYYAYGIKKAILCTGGDFIHFDNHRSETANKTVVESDSRYQKVFRAGCDAIVECLEFLERLFNNVRFINVSGNHDLTTSFYLGEYMLAYFKDSESVEIDNAPRLRKYYQFGQTCFMFTHGDKAYKRLPMIFSREFSEFSKCMFPEIHVGHLHRESKDIFRATEELNGVLVRTFNSLSGADSWHDQEGYIGSIKKADGLIYSEKYGKIGEVNEVIV